MDLRSLLSGRRIDDLQPCENPEVTVSGRDGSDAVFAHEGRDVNVVVRVSAHGRRLVEDRGEEARVLVCFTEHVHSRFARQALDEGVGRGGVDGGCPPRGGSSLNT